MIKKCYLQLVLISTLSFNALQAEATMQIITQDTVWSNSGYSNGDDIVFDGNDDWNLTIDQLGVVIGNLSWDNEDINITDHPGSIKIGADPYAGELILQPKQNTNISYIGFNSLSGKLILDSKLLSSNLINTPAQGDQSQRDNHVTFFSTSPITGYADVDAIVQIRAKGKPLGFSVQLGELDKRVESVSFEGDSLIEGDIFKPVYAKDLYFDTSGYVILPPVVLINNSAIAISSDLKVGTISHSNNKGRVDLNGRSTINLNGYKFNAISKLGGISKYQLQPNQTGDGDAPLQIAVHGSLQINTYFDKTVNDGGRFIMEAETKLTAYDNMIINLTTNANEGGRAYNLFTGEIGSIDVPIANRILGGYGITNDTTKDAGQGTRIITFIQPAPGAIYWTYDPSTHLISSHISPVQYVPPPSTPPGVTSPPITKITFTDTSVLPPENITAAVARLVPSNFGKIAADEANDSAIRDVASRSFKIPEDNAIENIGVSSGEVDKQYSGVWVSSFMQKASQKDTDKIYGYKLTNYGGTLGVDTMLNDHLALGVAWTTLSSKVKMSNLKVGDKANINTNIFSVYSLYNLPDRWFVQSHISAGQGNVSTNEMRYRSDNTLGIASSRYKSYTYNAHANLGKRLNITEGIDFIPSLGIIYNAVKSDGYKERGDVPTVSVGKRSSYAIDAVIAARVYGRYDYYDLVLKPEVSATAQVNLNRRNMKVNYTSDFLEPTSIEVRQSKSWYSLGAGLTIYKDMMEYALDYEAQIDKKYLGHVGSIKIRLNF